LEEKNNNCLKEGEERRGKVGHERDAEKNKVIEGEDEMMLREGGGGGGDGRAGEEERVILTHRS
jgi:hypothetical protein